MARKLKESTKPAATTTPESPPIATKSKPDASLEKKVVKSKKRKEPAPVAAVVEEITGQVGKKSKKAKADVAVPMEVIVEAPLEKKSKKAKAAVVAPTEVIVEAPLQKGKKAKASAEATVAPVETPVVEGAVEPAQKKSKKSKAPAVVEEEIVEPMQKKAKKAKIATAVLEDVEKPRSTEQQDPPVVIAKAKSKKPKSARNEPKVATPVFEDEWTGFGEEEYAETPKEKMRVLKKSSEKKSTSKVQASEPESEPEAAPEESGSDAEEEGYLHGFSSDDQDSSDDEDMVVDTAPIDVQKLPTIARDDKSVKQKLDKAKRLPADDRGVIYLGRIPHGFYEEQMKAYFTQFGNVTRIRLSRSRKTGRSKHYGFIEFDSLRVAEIVAETMDNYLLTGHILRCKVVPKSELHSELWIGANKKFKVLPRARLERDAHNKLRTEGEQGKATERLIRRQQLKKRKLEEMGIEYTFEKAAYAKKSKVVAA